MGVTIRPVMVNAMPKRITKAFDLLRTSIPRNGWANPYTSAPAPIQKLMPA